MASQIEFNGYKYRLEGGYYRRKMWKGVGFSSLHRAVWAHHNGPTPDGFHVHHIDGDPTNNATDNLKLLSASEHNREHARHQHATGNLKPTGEFLRKMVPTPEWREAARVRAKQQWSEREMRTATCEVCGTEFQTFYAKVCGGNCKQRRLYQRRKLV